MARRWLRRRRNRRNDRRKRRMIKDRKDPFHSLTIGEIFERYRFRPETIQYIEDLIGADLTRPTGRSYSLSVRTQILIALRFFATGANYLLIGDSIEVSKTASFRAVRDVTDALCRIAKDFIKMPTAVEDIAEMKAAFYKIAGFPNVVGCVDGTFIRIVGPKQNENDYVNRKGFHSLNVQMICDHRFRILNCVAKWPGSVHDSRVFRESAVCRQFEEGKINGLLLGDSGYGVRSYLMTPFLVPAESCHSRFNDAHARTRVTVEQTFGILKKRFQCLQVGMRVEPQRACAITVACVVLHNIGIIRGDIVDSEASIPEMDDDAPVAPAGVDGKGMRDFIARNYF